MPTLWKMTSFSMCMSVCVCMSAHTHKNTHTPYKENWSWVSILNDGLDAQMRRSAKRNTTLLLIYTNFDQSIVALQCCQSLLYNKVNQPYLYVYSLSFGFPSYLGHHRALSRVPSAIQQVLISYLLYTQWCICGIGDSFKNYKQNYQMTQQYYSRVYTWRKP